MFGLMKTISLDTFGTVHMVYKDYITSSPTILTLWNFWIHVCILNCCDIVTNVKVPVDYIFSFGTTLRVPNIDLDDGHVRFR